MDIQDITNKVIEVAGEYGIKVIGAIAIWFIGSWVIKKMMRGVDLIMDKRSFDEGLKGFLLNLLG